jgi:hypothetical protein
MLCVGTRVDAEHRDQKRRDQNFWEAENGLEKTDLTFYPARCFDGLCRADSFAGDFNADSNRHRYTNRNIYSIHCDFN